MVVNIWASLEGGPVHILATKFNFMEKFAGIPVGGGSKACGLIWGNGWTTFRGTCQGFNWIAVDATSFRVFCRFSLGTF